MSSRLDPVSRPHDFGIHPRCSTSSRPWQTFPQHRSRRSFSIENKSDPIDRMKNVDQSDTAITARLGPGNHHVRIRVRRPRGLIERTWRRARGRTGERRVHHRTRQPWWIRRTSSFNHWSKKAVEGGTLSRRDRTTGQSVFDQWTPTWYPPCCTRKLLI